LGKNPVCQARYANELESERVYIKDIEEAILMLASLQITLHKMSASWGYEPTCLLDIFTVVSVLVTLPLCLSIVLPKESSTLLMAGHSRHWSMPSREVYIIFIFIL
jgi:hypothetical protein